MNCAESIAKRLFEAVLIGSRMEYRVEQSRGQHDIDLHHLDGSVDSVEVTSSVDQALEQTYARIRRDGFMVKTKLCKKDWLIHPARSADPRLIRSKADQYLADIELEGIDHFLAPTNWHSPSVERIYLDLAVVSGSVYPWREPGQIGMALPAGGGDFKMAHAAVNAGKAEAFKADNRRKLRAASTDTRHLAVFVFATNYNPWCALLDCIPPDEPVHLPPEVTDLWLFAETRSTNEYVVWRASASLGWRAINTSSFMPQAARASLDLQFPATKAPELPSFTHQR
jgi:hypothetical protein